MTETKGIRDVVRGGVVAAAAFSARWSAPRAVIQTDRAPRILLLRPDHLGDVLLSTPAITALRAALPHARITALVGPWAASVLDNNPDVDEVATLKFPGFDRSAPHEGTHAYSLLVSAARALRAQRFDLAVNLRPDFWWGAALLALAGIPQRIGFDLAPGRTALTQVLPVPAPDEHAVLRSLRAVRQAARLLGADAWSAAPVTPQSAPLTFRLTDADRAWAGGWLVQHGLSAGAAPLVLHPGSGAAIKAWVPRKWATVVSTLAQALDAPVLVTGGPDERAQVEAITRILPPDVPACALADDMPLGRFAALLERARLVLGVDSGPLHLATAVGTPTVRLFGPTSAAIFGPWGAPGAHVALESPLACAPCGRLDYSRAELPTHPCVRLLAPVDVVAAAHEALRAAPSRQPHPQRPTDSLSSADRESTVAP